MCMNGLVRFVSKVFNNKIVLVVGYLSRIVVFLFKKLF